MSDITQLMLDLCSMNAQVRGNAEQVCYQARDSDLAGFVIALIHELRDDSKPVAARQSAGLMLKNSVALKLRDIEAKEELEGRWKALALDVRSEVKREVLETLGSPSQEVRQIAANVIANLARIELPASEWPDLIGVLVSACSEGSDLHIEAALTTLGYICEESNTSEPLEEILAQQSNPILTAVCVGMNSSNADIQYYATKALCNAMEFCHANMNDDKERTYLVGVVCNAVKAVEERTRATAMECLVKVAELYYSTLPQYIGTLLELTTSAIRNDTEIVALQAMQFWIAICEGEKEMKGEGGPAADGCLNYAMEGLNMMIEICSEVLVKQEEDQTEDDWNISIAGGKLLLALAECVGNAVVQPAMNFVYGNIQSANWREREAAVMAFGCILGGPEPEVIQDTVAQAVPGLLQYLNDPHELVSDTCGWVVSIVAELFTEALLEASTLQQLLNIIGPMLTGPEGMAYRACHIFHNLGLYYEEEDDQPSNELSPYFYDILAALLGAVDRPDSVRVKAAAQEALNAVIDATPADCYEHLMTLVPQLISRLSVLQPYAPDANSGDVLLVQGLLCGSLNGVTRKLGSRISSTSDPIVDALVAIMNQSQDTVSDEALLCVGALAQALEKNFEHYAPRLLPYVEASLKNVDEENLCNVALGVVGDVASALKDRFVLCAEPLLNPMATILQDPEILRDIKCSVISCLGDIALNLGVAFQPYLEGVMTTVEQLQLASRRLDISSNLDDEDYVMSLWDSICSMYTSVCQGFKSNPQPLLGYLPSILDFVLYIGPVCRQCEDTFRSCVGVVGDMANVVAASHIDVIRQAKPSLLCPGVYSTIEEGARSSDKATQSQAQWAMRQIRALESIN